MRFLPAALLVLALASPARGDGYLFLAGDPHETECGTVTVVPHSIVDVYVMANATYGIAGAWFRIPPPVCAEVTFVGATVLGGFMALGDVEAGISLTFGGCITAPAVALLKLEYLVGDGGCCEVNFRAHPEAQSGRVEFVACSYSEVSADEVKSGFFSMTPGDCGYSPQPGSPDPPDGATGVPIAFGWPNSGVGPTRTGCPPMLCPTEYRRIYFGTDPDPPLVWSYPQGLRDLGPLQPGTKYYWHIVFDNCGYLVDSPVWSFTTENATPAESRTWGAVKALYR
jgi:hypothetical protein